MKVVISYHFNEDLQANRIDSFLYKKVEDFHKSDLKENEIACESTLLPRDFFSKWYLYKVVEDRVVLNERLLTKWLDKK